VLAGDVSGVGAAVGAAVVLVVVEGGGVVDDVAGFADGVVPADVAGCGGFEAQPTPPRVTARTARMTVEVLRMLIVETQEQASFREHHHGSWLF
jgi:hypothetical protein